MKKTWWNDATGMLESFFQLSENVHAEDAIFVRYNYSWLLAESVLRGLRPLFELHYSFKAQINKKTDPEKLEATQKLASVFFLKKPFKTSLQQVGIRHFKRIFTSDTKKFFRPSNLLPTAC